MKLDWELGEHPVVKHAECENGTVRVVQGLIEDHAYTYSVMLDATLLKKFTGPHAYVDAWMWTEDQFGLPELTIHVGDSPSKLIEYVKKHNHVFNIDILYAGNLKHMEFVEVVTDGVNVVRRTPVPIVYNDRFSGFIVNYEVM